MFLGFTETLPVAFSKLWELRNSKNQVVKNVLGVFYNSISLISFCLGIEKGRYIEKKRFGAITPITCRSDQMLFTNSRLFEFIT